MLEIGNGPGQLAPSASTIKGRHGIDRAAGRKWRERKQRGRSKNKRLRQAVHRHKPISKQGIQERLFTLAFSGLVYPQIWEDPLVDLEALALREDKHLVAIASGGCNILSYVATCPIRITAVDLNPSHVALNKLKLAAIRHLPDYRALHRFFAEADARENLHAYEDYVRPYLDETSRRYWEARDLFGRRRISYFRTCLYRHGLLGNFIGASHLLTRLHGRNPRKILAAKSLEEQRKIFESDLAPLFEKRHVRWLLNRPSALFGLGIPPSQFEVLKGNETHMATVVRKRLERLACGFDLSDNYFAWQAFGRSYAPGRAGPLPPYLLRENFDNLRSRIGDVDVQHRSFTECLASKKEASIDEKNLPTARNRTAELPNREFGA